MRRRRAACAPLPLAPCLPVLCPWWWLASSALGLQSTSSRRRQAPPGPRLSQMARRGRSRLVLHVPRALSSCRTRFALCSTSTLIGST